MSAVASLTKMQRDAVEQLRAGDHSEFLVGFLTTSVMLELSNLLLTELDLADYAQAVVETVTQHAPVDRCLLGLQPVGLPPVAAAVGFDESFTERFPGLTDGPECSVVDIADVVRATLLASPVPEPLREAGFVALAANQIGDNLMRVIEAERLRRREAVARGLSVVALLDDDWGETQLQDLARSLASLPDVAAATVSAQAARFAGRLSATAGRPAGPTLERRFTVDGRIEVDILVHHLEPPTEEHHGRIDEIVTALAASLERIEQNIRLLAEAETDQLTGVGNRRRAGKALTAARAMADRHDGSMSVLLCDLDHFKRVNDEHGHDVGDRVLVRFADLLQRMVRPFDTVTRWGGEEFLVVLPSCDLEDAVAVADRLIRECPGAAGDLLPSGTRLTVSIGVATYPAAAPNPETLVRAADDALYQAKRDGRDRFQVATQR